MERDWSSAQFVKFEAGRSVPIPAGNDRAKRDLDHLTGSKVLVRIGGQTVTLPIADLVRLRGRWRLFRLYE